MKFFKKLFTLFVVGFVFFIPFVTHAMTPTLSLSGTGSGDSVQINVNGDPNASVLLNYTATGSGLTIQSIGTTNSSGSFTTTVSSSQYNIAQNSIVYVTTGGLSGAQSNHVTWPYFSTSTSLSTLTLSQGAVLLNAGQTSTVTANANFLYVLSNSNPSIANINLNANQITITANTYGSTTVNICIVGSTTNCSNISVTVQNSSAQQLYFSQNNFSIVSGQTANVTVTGGSGSYTISNNSNSTSVQANINGSTVTLTANGTNGASSITVCTVDMNNCGIINVSSTTVNSSSITFSQTNPVVSLSQSTTVTIYGGVSGSNFYVSSNSNPSIVQANITNNILTLVAGSATGSSTINICVYSGNCASLTANVSNISGNGAMSLSQSSISILAGQSSNITILGGSSPYSVSASSSNIFNTNVTGNILTVYAVNPGTATANVCSSVGCTTLSVTISSTNSSINPPSFSQNNILLSVGQQSTVNISGTGNYYLSNNNSPNIASVTINGNTATVIGNSAGNSNVSICQNGGQCTVLYITVSAPVTQPVTQPITQPVVSSYVFPRYLGFGDKGDDVLQLQKLLKEKGFLKATPNGHYGPSTKLSVQTFQKAHNIRQTGNVGQATKDLLNQISSTLSSMSTSDTSKEQQISTIQQTIQQLLAQVAQIKGQ